MRNLLTFLVLILISKNSFAQYADTNYYGMERINQELFSSQISGDKYINCSGTPYLNKDFIIGNILDNKKKQKYEIPLRFNIYKNTFEAKIDNDTIVELSNNNDFSYELLKQKFTKNNIEIDGKKSSIFIEELFSGKKSKLFKRYSKKLLPPKRALSSYEKDKPARFVTTEYIMYSFSNKPINSFPKKKKEFYKLFGKKSSIIESYVKKQKLSLKNSGDLIKIFKYYENL